jgi:hypothetical protein
MHPDVKMAEAPASIQAFFFKKELHRSDGDPTAL